MKCVRRLGWLFVLSIVAVDATADQMGPAGPVLSDHELAVARAGCTHGDAAACDRHGNGLIARYFSAHAKDGDAETARASFERGCDLGSIPSCTDLAWVLSDGVVKRDTPRAAALLEKSCAAKDGHACVMLGMMIDPGLPPSGIKPDIARAFRLYRQTCDGDVSGLACTSGCVGLATWTYYGESRLAIEEDHAAADTLLERACTAGCINSCAEIGDHYRDGDGVARDLATAAERYRTSCDAGFAPSCSALGKLYLAGAGVPRDKVRAKKLLIQSCKKSGGGMEPCGLDESGSRIERALVECKRANPPVELRDACTDLFAFETGGGVAGHVARAGKPVAEVSIVIDDSAMFVTRTDARGGFSLRDVPAGHHVIHVLAAQAPSYNADLEVTAGDVHVLQIDLQR